MTPTLPKPETATEGPEATNTSIRTTMMIQRIRQSMADSVAPNPVNGRSHSNETKTVHQAWTEYLIDLARYTALVTSLPTIPTEAVGSSNRPAS